MEDNSQDIKVSAVPTRMFIQKGKYIRVYTLCMMHIFIAAFPS